MPRKQNFQAAWSGFQSEIAPLLSNATSTLKEAIAFETRDPTAAFEKVQPCVARAQVVVMLYLGFIRRWRPEIQSTAPSAKRIEKLDKEISSRRDRFDKLFLENGEVYANACKDFPTEVECVAAIKANAAVRLITSASVAKLMLDTVCVLVDANISSLRREIANAALAELIKIIPGDVARIVARFVR